MTNLSHVVRVPAQLTNERARLPRRQRGVVLFIALIMLVAMTLAGIAMVRSVDTTLGIAGNLAFRQTTLQSGDQAVQSAYTWLVANASGVTLQNTDMANGYYASINELNWFDINAWNAAITLNNGTPDAAGNVTRYIVHRMCTQAGVAYNATGNLCALYYPEGGASTGGSMSVGAVTFPGQPQLYYRVSIRVDGPRNTVSVTQVNILIQT